MQLSITFRHMDPSDSVKEYAREKIDRIRKYFPDPIKGHIVFSVDRYQHTADVVITLHNGLVIKGVETTEDVYSSMDLVMAKIERQVRRYKDKIQDHKPAEGPLRMMRHRVVEVPGSDATTAAPVAAKAPSVGERPEPRPAAPNFRIIKEEKYVARPMSVEQAIMQMNLNHERFLCFNNAVTHEVNVVYLREDGSFGLIETHPGHEGHESPGAHPAA